MSTLEFESFRKIPRLFKNTVTITEKIDGTNGQIVVADDGNSIVAVGSRSRWITPDNDNFGFARWVRENEQELLKLGPGRHYGEWWGAGIQRGYGLDHKRFSLFNVHKWNDDNKPACCHVVPILMITGVNDLFSATGAASHVLKTRGSQAASGFTDPEGICLYFSEFGSYAKYTFDGDNHKELKV